ncbi:DUF805 domain-containing protein [Virgibacillus pantothenticus]|uniref:DUF805 domain-containing protein n=1 Tax=Virgibacillus pantothenticus TaxID=1473 RepID=A0A0L0QNQ1_VIRPA|nr:MULTISPECIES: DUF805 domain-containing protein [Virgibacillus]API93977.1 hypothetical protein BKP57_20380 [Virgibacillus sp. 6R]KNE20260.1 hypothetical protein AFK71_17890 [Virgibacillus pantothenticus]MBS7427476.1 DUF805 domain-containing protein [Virgibacillus sp. 19R1-5]MED3735811.1 DUF805 domain-containing protein [Virgibacillus pantothenticus]QTY17990.1 DUF805 domain-containing protein [Virgibacillus pantothenticus]
MKWFIKCLKNYATFRGRARRKEFWMFTLVYMLILFASVLLLSLVSPELLSDDQTAYGTSSTDADLGIGGGILTFLLTIFYISMILPSLAVTVRRLHDTGKSGWWYFIIFIPFVGWIILTIFLILDSEPNENKYGPNPKLE